MNDDSNLIDNRQPNEDMEYYRLQMIGRELTRRISEAIGRGEVSLADDLLAEKNRINRRMGRIHG